MLQSQTKSTKNTIWRPIREIEFFKNVKRVHDACGDCPRPPQVFDRRPPATASAYVSSYKIPLEVEYQLVNDLAFIAAAYEGAKSVSAAAVSENAQSRGMTFTVASNAGVPKDVEAALREICHELQRCSCSGRHRLIQRCAGSIKLSLPRESPSSVFGDSLCHCNQAPQAENPWSDRV